MLESVMYNFSRSCFQTEEGDRGDGHAQPSCLDCKVLTLCKNFMKKIQRMISNCKIFEPPWNFKTFYQPIPCVFLRPLLDEWVETCNPWLHSMGAGKLLGLLNIRLGAVDLTLKNCLLHFQKLIPV